jgi:hypothetical protein
MSNLQPETKIVFVSRFMMTSLGIFNGNAFPGEVRNSVDVCANRLALFLFKIDEQKYALKIAYDDFVSNLLSNEDSLCKGAVKRRHPNKKLKWIKFKYFQSIGSRNWVFRERDSNIALLKLSDIPIRRHIKIKSDANPYDPDWSDYCVKRSKRFTAGCLAAPYQCLPCRPVNDFFEVFLPFFAPF